MQQGMSALTFGSLAQTVGTNDRTIVYYFPTKADLISEVTLALNAELRDVLEHAFAPDRLSIDDLIRHAWPLLATPARDPLFAAVLEVAGLAAARRDPYAELAPLLVNGWIDWLTPRIEPAEPGAARREAQAAVAQLVGLLLLRQVSGATIANRAARQSGVVDYTPARWRGAPGRASRAVVGGRTSDEAVGDPRRDLGHRPRHLGTVVGAVEHDELRHLTD